MYHTTESALAADLVLPAAGWGEKDGCFINSERRIGTIKAVRKAPGQALSDFRIFRLIAEAWGCGKTFEHWTHPEAAFKILRDLTRDRPCDITGIRDYEHIDAEGGIQWPYPASAIPEGKERRLFEDGRFYTPSGKALLLFSPPAPQPDPVDSDFPFLMMTGRGTSSQWHTGTRSGKSDILRKMSPDRVYAEMAADDAAKMNFENGSLIEIRSRRSNMQATVYISPTVRPGQIFVPMHYAEVNRPTHSSFDPHSRQPNYKATAVAIRSMNAWGITSGFVQRLVV